MNDPSQETKTEKLAVRIITYVALFLTPVLLLYIAIIEPLYKEPYGARRWITIGDFRLISRQMLQEHFAAVIGLPMAAIMSLWVVTILRDKSGPIEFEVLGLKFRGASGPVILWILCFLTISIAIKLVW